METKETLYDINRDYFALLEECFPFSRDKLKEEYTRLNGKH